MALLIAVFALFSCQKNVNEDNLLDANKSIASSAEKLMQDDYFNELVKSYTLVSEEVGNLNINDFTNYASIDTNSKIQLTRIHASLSSSFANFFVNNPGFIQETKEKRFLILKYIQDSISSESYRLGHPTIVNKLVSTDNSIVKVLNAQPVKAIKTFGTELRIKSNKVSINLVLGCAIGSLMSGLSSYENAIQDIVYLVTQGITGSALFSMAFDVVKNASPWWKVASILVTFGSCVLPSIE